MIRVTPNTWPPVKGQVREPIALAEDNTIDDYIQMPVEEFGEAYLRAYGWKDEISYSHVERKGHDEYVGLGYTTPRVAKLEETKPDAGIEFLDRRIEFVEARIEYLDARIEYANFLQETVKEMAKEVKSLRSGEAQRAAEELDEFMDKVKRGTHVPNEEILEFAKLFNDELTLDNMSRPRLMNMCEYMGINLLGTNADMRFKLQKKLRKIKNDDKMIQAEGVQFLANDELRRACQERGLLGLVSVEDMRQRLQDWLDRSLNHSEPSSLLILSRAFTAVQATLSSLSDEAKMNEKKGGPALRENTPPTAKEAEVLKKTKTLDQQEHLFELSRALAVLASASSVSLEHREFLRLVIKEIELYNSMVDKGRAEGEEEARKAYKAAREEDPDHTKEKTADDKVSSALKVDAMLHKREKEIGVVDAKIGDPWRLLDRDSDGKVTPAEVASAAAYLKDTLAKEGIQEFITNLSKDREGKMLVEDLVKLASEIEDAE